MTQNDWRAYAAHLESQLKGVDIKSPTSIGEAVNNYNVTHDLSNVLETKINAKAQA